jgi:mannose/fructose-specific phosphotransferase system component IIA
MSDIEEPIVPRALVAGHGDFATGVVSAVDQITGRGGVLIPLTNRGLGADEIVRTLRDAVIAASAQVIFTDLPAGSWTIACASATAARHAADKGRGAMAVLGGGVGSGGAD